MGGWRNGCKLQKAGSKLSKWKELQITIAIAFDVQSLDAFEGASEDGLLLGALLICI